MNIFKREFHLGEVKLPSNYPPLAPPVRMLSSQGNLPCKPGNLSSILGTHVKGEGEDERHRPVLWSSHEHCGMHQSHHKHIHNDTHTQEIAHVLIVPIDC